MAKFNHEDYNIPLTDYDCYDRYHKHIWIYDLAKMRDNQHLKYDLFKTDECTQAVKQSSFNKDATHLIDEEFFHGELERGCIFIPPVSGEAIFTDMIIYRGEIKWFKHHDQTDFLDTIHGELELRALAIVALFFQSFNGIMSFQSYGPDIFVLHLHPDRHMITKYDDEAQKLIKKIFKKI